MDGHRRGLPAEHLDEDQAPWPPTAPRCVERRPPGRWSRRHVLICSSGRRVKPYGPYSASRAGRTSSRRSASARTRWCRRSLHDLAGVAVVEPWADRDAGLSGVGDLSTPRMMAVTRSGISGPSVRHTPVASQAERCSAQTVRRRSSLPTRSPNAWRSPRSPPRSPPCSSTGDRHPECVGRRAANDSETERTTWVVLRRDHGMHGVGPASTPGMAMASSTRPTSRPLERRRCARGRWLRRPGRAPPGLPVAAPSAPGRCRPGGPRPGGHSRAGRDGHDHSARIAGPRRRRSPRTHSQTAAISSASLPPCNAVSTR